MPAPGRAQMRVSRTTTASPAARGRPARSRRVAQAADALACMEWQLSGAEVAALDAAAALCSVTAAQNIFSVE